MLDRRAWRIGAVLAALVLFAFPGAASAHIGHRDAVDLYNGISGPYDLRIVTVPLLSSFETTVVVRPGASPVAAFDPIVTVRATSWNGDVLGPERAPQAPGAPEQYAVLWSVSTEGDWLLEVSVESPLGVIEHQLPVTLRSGGGFPWSLAFIGVVLLAPALLSLGLARRRSNARRRRGA